MPWPTYSETFVRTTALGVWTVYTVPAGMRAVVKSVLIINSSGSTGQAYVKVGGIYVMSVQFQASDRARLQEMMAVAYAGQKVEVNLRDFAIDATVSGFLFGAAGAASNDPPPVTHVVADEPELLPAAA